jgi:hypothetical protein
MRKVSLSAGVFKNFLLKQLFTYTVFANRRFLKGAATFFPFINMGISPCNYVVIGN